MRRVVIGTTEDGKSAVIRIGHPKQFFMCRRMNRPPC